MYLALLRTQVNYVYVAKLKLVHAQDYISVQLMLLYSFLVELVHVAGH